MLLCNKYTNNIYIESKYFEVNFHCSFNTTNKLSFKRVVVNSALFNANFDCIRSACINRSHSDCTLIA